MELDLEATTREYARTRQLVPAFRPAPERWFDVALLIDESPTMTVWEEVVAEFGDLLQQLGAFRLVPQLATRLRRRDCNSAERQRPAVRARSDPFIGRAPTDPGGLRLLRRRLVSPSRVAAAAILGRVEPNNAD